jgi:phosphate acetyltransferase
LGGEESKIAARLASLDISLDIESVNIVDPINSEMFDDYAETLF